VTGRLDYDSGSEELTKSRPELMSLAKNFEKQLQNATNQSLPSTYPQQSPQTGKVPIPEAIISRIWNDNTEFILERQILDPEYFKFVWGIVNLYGPSKKKKEGMSPREGKEEDKSKSVRRAYDPELHMIQFATKFLLQLFSRTNDREALLMWISRLKVLYESNQDATRWLLKLLINDPKLIEFMLLGTHNPEKVRQAYSEMIGHGLKALAATEQNLYAATRQKIDDLFGQENPIIPGHSLKGYSYSLWFIETLLRMLPSKVVRKNSSDQFFSCFLYFASVSLIETSMLIDMGMVQTLGRFLQKKKEFASEEKSKTTPIYSPYVSALNQINYNNFSSRLASIIDIIAHLFCACKFSSAVPPTSELFFMEDYEFIFSRPKKFLHKVIKNEMNPKAIIKIAQHNCWENLPRSDIWFKDIIYDGIHGSNGFLSKSEAVRPYMVIFMGILEMEDDVGVKRIEEGTEWLLKMMKMCLNNNYRDTFDRLANWIPKLLANSRFKYHISKREQKNRLLPLLEKGGYTLALKTQ